MIRQDQLEATFKDLWVVRAPFHTWLCREWGPQAYNRECDMAQTMEQALRLEDR